MTQPYYAMSIDELYEANKNARTNDERFWIKIAIDILSDKNRAAIQRLRDALDIAVRETDIEKEYLSIREKLFREMMWLIANEEEDLYIIGKNGINSSWLEHAAFRATNISMQSYLP